MLCTTYQSEKVPLYRDKRTACFAANQRIKEFQNFEKQAKLRLVILLSAKSLRDLALLPSNRFEALIGNRKDQFSIRINSKWRLCFEWNNDQARPLNIEISLYH